MIKNNKSQSAIEFVILIGVFLFFFSIFFFAIQVNMGDKIRERYLRDIKEIALSVQDEINLADQSSEGYYREFDIPLKTNGHLYSINITESLIYIRTPDGKNALTLPTKEVYGRLVLGKNTIQKINGEIKLNSGMQFFSSDFKNQDTIPIKYASCGVGSQNINPTLNVTQAPSGTNGFVLLIEDIDSGIPIYVHWAIWNLSSNFNNISEDEIPTASIQGRNSAPGYDYIGPCPPAGPSHRYLFRLYALDIRINETQDTTIDDIKLKMANHILDYSDFIGRYP